jgi:predicted secreted protein
MYHWTITFEDGKTYEVKHTTSIVEAIKIALLNSPGKSHWDIKSAERRPVNA